MKHSAPVIKNLLAALICLLTLHSANAFAWHAEAVPDNSAIQVWTQAVPGSDFKAFKGQVTINASQKTILKTIHNTAALPQWYHNTVEARKIKKISENESINYTVTKAPWPVTDRDSVTHATTLTQNDGSIKITLQGEPDAYPLQKDRIRIPRLNGFWLLEALSANQTRVTLQISAEPGGKIPGWLANAMVIDMPLNTLNNLKSRLENRQ